MLESKIKDCSNRQYIALNNPHSGMFGKAAALFESVARNCFHNGNKRTAFASLDVFLKKNGYKLKKNDVENEDFTVMVAQGKATISDIAGWLEENCEKR